MQKFKLAAIDLDGTLLGPDRKISSENLCAIQQLQQAGLHVVLASGRHYLNMRRYADAIPGVEWIVSCQGGEVADVARKVVLNRVFLSPGGAQRILKLGYLSGFTAIIYTVDGIHTYSEWNPDLELYSAIAGYKPLQLTEPKVMDYPAFKIIWLASSEILSQALREIVLPPEIQMVRTHERMIEVMPAQVNKATGLQAIAKRLNLAAAQTMVFGDGDNDVPMFGWAGVSFAMAHGWPAARQSATHITTEGPSETAFARAVQHALQLACP